MTNPAALKAALAGDIENTIAASTPGDIERQEQQGQQALVQSTHMPVEMHPSREAFEKVGFKFGKKVDDLFYETELPPGWTREATGHAMHSDVLDEKGRKRVGVFYKAAFYDRRADAVLQRRFTVDMVFGGAEEWCDSTIPAGQVAFAVKDGGKIIHRLPPIGDRDYDAQDRDRAAALEWLRERHQNLDDPTANWDLP